MLRGGTLDLHGASSGGRWTRLGSTAPAGEPAVRLAESRGPWPNEGKVLIGSTSYNWQQIEERSITAKQVGRDRAVTRQPPACFAALDLAAVAALLCGLGGLLCVTLPCLAASSGPSQSSSTTLQLNRPLVHTHFARTAAVGGTDMRAEVALVSSNVVVESAEGAALLTTAGGDRYGCRIVVTGPSTARLSNVAVRGGPLDPSFVAWLHALSTGVLLPAQSAVPGWMHVGADPDRALPCRPPAGQLLRPERPQAPRHPL